MTRYIDPTDPMHPETGDNPTPEEEELERRLEEHDDDETVTVVDYTGVTVVGGLAYLEAYDGSIYDNLPAKPSRMCFTCGNINTNGRQCAWCLEVYGTDRLMMAVEHPELDALLMLPDDGQTYEAAITALLEEAKS